MKKSRTEHDALPAFSLSFSRLGGHQPIQAGVLRELIDQRHDCTADFNQAVSGWLVADIAHLGGRSVQNMSQNLAVIRGLIEHQQKFAVGEHHAGGIGAQTLVG